MENTRSEIEESDCTGGGEALQEGLGDSLWEVAEFIEM